MYNQAIIPLKCWTTVSIVVIILLNGCVSLPFNPTPRSGEKPYVGPRPGAGTSTFPIGTGPGNTNNFYHTVTSGETLYGVAARYGLNYKDVARWNNIPPPYTLNTGQTLVLAGSAGSNIPAPVYTTPSPDTNTFTRDEDINTDEANYHTVFAKETLYSVAKRYGRSKAEIRTWNNLLSDKLSPGQRLRITPPAGSEAIPPVQTTKNPYPPEPTSPTTTKSSGQHVVQEKDTLYSVAKLYGYAPADIAAWNDIQPPYNLTTGQILIVSPPSAVTPSSHEANLENKAGYYTVVAGDTLFSISKRYKCTVADLKTWNNLPSQEVSVGQLLRVSGAAAEMPATLSPPSIHSTKRTVRKGETLYRIASEVGMTEAELAKLNGIGPPYTVYPGQELTIIPKK